MSGASQASLDAIGCPVSRETFESLVQFEAMLVKWNRSVNLIAASTEDDIWSRHVLDSGQLLPLAPNALRWLDIGSGGGFPGLVLALLLKDRLGASIDLVESNRKKAGFLQAVVGHFRLPARVHPTRIEDCPVKDVEVVTARAVAALKPLLALSQPWIGTGARALFHKGRGYAQEIAESAHSWTFDLIEHPSAIDPAGMILEISNLKPQKA